MTKYLIKSTQKNKVSLSIPSSHSITYGLVPFFSSDLITSQAATSKCQGMKEQTFKIYVCVCAYECVCIVCVDVCMCVRVCTCMGVCVCDVYVTFYIQS